MKKIDFISGVLHGCEAIAIATVTYVYADKDSETCAYINGAIVAGVEIVIEVLKRYIK